jgi:hypothetical protein
MKNVQRICTERNTASINRNEMTEYAENHGNKNNNNYYTYNNNNKTSFI